MVSPEEHRQLTEHEEPEDIRPPVGGNRLWTFIAVVVLAGAGWFSAKLRMSQPERNFSIEDVILLQEEPLTDGIGNDSAKPIDISLGELITSLIEKGNRVIHIASGGTDASEKYITGHSRTEVEYKLTEEIIPSLQRAADGRPVAIFYEVDREYQQMFDRFMETGDEAEIKKLMEDYSAAPLAIDPEEYINAKMSNLRAAREAGFDMRCMDVPFAEFEEFSRLKASMARAYNSGKGDSPEYEKMQKRFSELAKIREETSNIQWAGAISSYPKEDAIILVVGGSGHFIGEKAVDDLVGGVTILTQTKEGWLQDDVILKASWDQNFDFIVHMEDREFEYSMDSSRKFVEQTKMRGKSGLATLTSAAGKQLQAYAFNKYTGEGMRAAFTPMLDSLNKANREAAKGDGADLEALMFHLKETQTLFDRVPEEIVQGQGALQIVENILKETMAFTQQLQETQMRVERQTGEQRRQR